MAAATAATKSLRFINCLLCGRPSQPGSPGSGPASPSAAALLQQTRPKWLSFIAAVGTNGQTVAHGEGTCEPHGRKSRVAVDRGAASRGRVEGPDRWIALETSSAAGCQQPAIRLAEVPPGEQEVVVERNAARRNVSRNGDAQGFLVAGARKSHRLLVARVAADLLDRVVVEVNGERPIAGPRGQLTPSDRESTNSDVANRNVHGLCVSVARAPKIPARRRAVVSTQQSHLQPARDDALVLPGGLGQMQPLVDVV